MSYFRPSLGDALEDMNRCKLNPSDPVCKTFYAGPTAPSDPWASQGSGTFNPNQFITGLKALFSPKPPSPTAPKSIPMIPIAIGVGAVAIAVMLLKKKANR